MPAPFSAAEILVRAGRAARSLKNRILVVKLGGSAMEVPAATRGTLESVVTLQTLGVRLVLVHGGGKPIDRAMAAAGLTVKKIAGRRYTDDETLKIVVTVLTDMCSELLDQLREISGDSAAGEVGALFGERLTLTGADGESIDLGHVGRITRVDTAKLRERLDYFRVLVMPSLALTDDGSPRFLNINADTAASAVAGALDAEAVLFLTDTPGILRDIRNPQSHLPRLTRSECEQLIRDDVIVGGMIPKVEACFEALDAGAGRAVILDGRNPYVLLEQFLGEPAGTEIVP